jgi:hypothetical protein
MSKEFIKSQNIVVSNIVFTPPEDNPRSSGQKIGFIRYKEDPEDSKDTTLKVLIPEIITEAYGIPKEGKYYPDAASRAFYKFPFAHDRKKYEGTVDYDAIEGFFNKLRKIDQHCDTDHFRLQMFGEKLAGKYQYQPLVRTPEEEEGEATIDKDGNPYYRPPYTKIKLGLKYTTAYPDFLIFEKQNGARKKVQLDTFDDVVKYINYLSRVRMVISFSKLYAAKTAPGNEKRKYGIVLKATHVEVQPHRQMERISMNEDPFVDSDQEEEVHEH